MDDDKELHAIDKDGIAINVIIAAAITPYYDEQTG